ncbi:MAG: M24 family metallopeptidase [Candidatus Nitrosocosmicus sp.]
MSKKGGKSRGNDRKIKILLFRPENIYYLTNFWGEGIAILSEGDGSQIKLVVPKLEYTRALNTSRDCDVIPSERGTTLINTTTNTIKDNEFVFSDSNDFDAINKIQKKTGNENMVIDSNLLYNLREIKDTQEIENINNASKIIDRLFEIATKEIKENTTEEQIQATLVYEAMKLGARFPTYQYTTNPLIIASGPNGSFPHSETSNKKIKSGELIVIDLTLSYNHYVSDATRTFGIGKMTVEMKKVYETVKASQEKGIEHINNTTDLGDIDACCRNAITEANLGDYFTHSTGHGIGLEVHEPPWIRPNSKIKIRENMAITIEPGIYIENKLGVRIEDSLLITKKNGKSNDSNDGYRFANFHHFSKDLIIL